MEDTLFRHINIKRENTHVPDGLAKNPNKYGKEYDRVIEEKGGIDIQILGIGRNGHIAFNEPDDELILSTHLTDLTKDTIDANSRFFDSIDEVPTKAITMGLGTIMKAKKIILMANGKNKAEIMGELLKGDKVTTGLPASLLLLHPDVTVIMDEEAAELEGAKESIKYLKEKGITISAGHTNATFDEAKAGIDLGITHATHLYNGMRAYSHREPGVIGAVLTDERVACEMISDGIHLHVGAMDLAVKMKGKSGIILISDAMMATGLDDGKYELGGQDVYVKEGAARLEDGTLAGSTLTLNKAVYNMVNMVNVPLEDAVRMASLNPAKAIGLDNKKGSIEIGKDADLIIFDENIDISVTIVKGQIKVFK